MSLLINSLRLISFLVLLSYENRFYATAFTIQNRNPTSSFAHAKISQFMVSDPMVSFDSTQKITDSNGVEFTEGCTIQICSEVKAYQVPKKGFGSFDAESNKFIPLEGVDDVGSVARVDKCLVIPKGMRGKITKVYDISEYDASLPLIAKFQDGEGYGGNFEPPVTFLMHFDTYEIEVVE